MLVRPPIDINTVASCLGVKKVMTRELDVPGLLYPLSQDSSVIVVNKASPLTRQRYTCAHEVAHILLSEPQKVSLSRRSPAHSHKAIERACEELAAEILMPRDVFTEHASQMGWTASSIQPLSNVFQTSMEATARRYVETIREACILAMWRSVQGEGEPKTKMTRYTKNRMAGPSDYRFRGPTAAESYPILRCLKGSKYIRGFQGVLVSSRRRGQMKNLYSEFIGYGSGPNRRVVSLIYPERESDGTVY